jgi:hypothetical protein
LLGNNWTTKIHDSQSGFQISRLGIPIDGKIAILINVSIPQSASPNSFDEVRLKVTSQNRSNEYFYCTINTKVSYLVPWFDGFETGMLSSHWTVESLGGYAGVGTQTSKAGTFSMYTSGGSVSVYTVPFDTSELKKVRVQFWVRSGSWNFGNGSEPPDWNEDLVVEYLNSKNSWKSIVTFFGGGTAGQIYDKVYNLTGDALHGKFRLRFRQTNGNGIFQDYWHIDNVAIRPPPPTTCIYSGRNIATEKVTQNTLNFTIANFTLLAINGYLDVKSITAHLTGTGSDSDIASVRFYEDADKNGNFSTKDKLLTVGVSENRKITFNGPWEILQDSSMKFVIVYNISHNADIGKTIGVRISPSDILLESPSVVRPFLTFQSTNTTILERIDHLRVIASDISPATVEQGQKEVEVMLIRLRAITGYITLNSLELIFIGTGEDSDIANIKLYNDSNLNGHYDAESDPLLSSGQLSWASLVLSDFEVVLLADSAQQLLVTFDISNNANIGRTIGAKFDINYMDINSPDVINPFSTCHGGPFVINEMSDTFPPVVPTGLAVKSRTYNSITLQWNENTDEDIIGYNVYRSRSPNPVSWGKSVGHSKVGKEEFADYGLTEGTTYYYVITAYDEIPNESNFSSVASGTTLFAPQAPTINTSQPNLEIPEDGYDISSINLYHWFEDLNDDELYFWCEEQKHIQVTIFQNNGTVLLVPEKNWNGQESLIFYAGDLKNKNDKVSDDVMVSVTPKNDPPSNAVILSPDDGFEVYQDTPIDFKASCDDPDLNYGDKLTYEWSSNISGVIGTQDTLRWINLPVGIHYIELHVYDKAGEFSDANIIITVLAEPVPGGGPGGNINNTTGDGNETSAPDKPTTPEAQDMTIIYGSIVITVVIAIILILFSFLLLKKKKAKKLNGKNEPLATKSNQKQKEENKITPPVQPQSSASTITKPISQGQNAHSQLEPPNQMPQTQAQYIQTLPLEGQQLK